MFSLASMGTSTPWVSSLGGTTSSMMSNGLLDINSGFGVGPLASKVPGGGSAGGNGAVSLLSSLGGSSGLGDTMGGIAQIGSALIDGLIGYKNYQLQKDNYNFQKSIMQENMAGLTGTTDMVLSRVKASRKKLKPEVVPVLSLVRMIQSF